MISNFSVGNKNNVHFKGYVNAHMEEGTSVASPALMGAQWRDRLQNGGRQPAPPQYDSGDSYASREEAPQRGGGDPYSGREEAPQRGGGDSYGGGRSEEAPSRSHHSSHQSSHHSSHHSSPKSNLGKRILGAYMRGF